LGRTEAVRQITNEPWSSMQMVKGSEQDHSHGVNGVCKERKKSRGEKEKSPDTGRHTGIPIPLGNRRNSTMQWTRANLWSFPKIERRCPVQTFLRGSSKNHGAYDAANHPSRANGECAGLHLRQPHLFRKSCCGTASKHLLKAREIALVNTDFSHSHKRITMKLHLNCG
jgi:hypothetical protein